MKLLPEMMLLASTLKPKTVNLTESDVVKFLARLMQIVGVPVAGFLAWHMWEGLESVKRDSEATRLAISQLKSEIHGTVNLIEWRLKHLER